MNGISNVSKLFLFSSPEAGSPLLWASDVQCIITKVKGIVNAVTLFQMVMVIEFGQSIDAVILRHAKPWRVGSLVDNDNVVHYTSVFRPEAFWQEKDSVFNLDLIQLFGAFCYVLHFVVV